MSRIAGTLSRFICSKCGKPEMVTGGTCGFQCSECRPPRNAQFRAHATVAKAIRKGKLQHPSAFSCADCGCPATQYDHRDYSKPLDVAPVCAGCNVRRGRAINHDSRSVGRPRKSAQGGLVSTDEGSLLSHASSVPFFAQTDETERVLRIVPR